MKKIILTAIAAAALSLSAYAGTGDKLELQIRGAWDQGRNSVLIHENPGTYRKHEIRLAFIGATGTTPTKVEANNALTKFKIIFKNGKPFVILMNGRNPISGRNKYDH